MATAFLDAEPRVVHGLGRLYTDDERFTAFYDRIEPGLAAYLAEAMAAYAEQRLD
ncbi:TipAS antibiotic-recognition domain-containing protein [Prauserella aidingensis]|nr:TipAS antibiotic-recognition domain-containing protein [Prauserella aidingensis]MCP2251815.1 TipAS antibiotic-recognition domain-containing protein [Prauserella aidingensis]